MLLGSVPYIRWCGVPRLVKRKQLARSVARASARHASWLSIQCDNDDGGGEGQCGCCSRGGGRGTSCASIAAGALLLLGFPAYKASVAGHSSGDDEGRRRRRHRDRV